MDFCPSVLKKNEKFCIFTSTEGQTIFRWISNNRSKFFNHFILSSNSLSECSFISWILEMTAFSSKSSVRDWMSRMTRGIFMIWWTGETNKSVSCSFLHRASLLHHCNEEWCFKWINGLCWGWLTRKPPFFSF